ncbi:hypothetical protein [Jiulongibacter sp. NS-SX5]|uniref:hypothetical protein n=1 Tax=Jiulongibacter sp. NS-SX5 TaxID=3463854 RepID=UPI0040594B1F
MKFLFLTLISFSLSAQVNLTLQKSSYDFGALNSYVKSIRDTRESPYFLGKVYLRNMSKTDLTLNSGTERAFLNNLQSLSQNYSGTPLYIEILKLSFEEKKGNNGLIDGFAQMRLKVFALHQNDTLELCSPGSTNRYNRSPGTAHSEAYEPLLRQMWEAAMKYTHSYIDQNLNRLEAFNTGSLVNLGKFQTVNRGDTVHYFSRKVNWSDFKGSPPPITKFAAAIFPSIAIETGLTIKDRKLVANIRPKVFMVPSQSWVKSGSRSESALRHEQLHFDITMVIMNDLISKLRKIEAYTVDDLSSMIQYQYLESFREMNRLQKEYDLETGHSTNSTAQLLWERKVASWLKDPTSYSL